MDEKEFYHREDKERNFCIWCGNKLTTTEYNTSFDASSGKMKIFYQKECIKPMFWFLGFIPIPRGCGPQNVETF